jgi:2-methylcitrate dehydratase PrpD
VNEGVLLHGGAIEQPREAIEAQFSLRFSLGVRLLKGSNDLAFYLDPKVWQDPEILTIGKKTKLSADPTATGPKRFACRMKITRTHGNAVEGYLPAPKGTAANPLTKEEVRNKFRRLGTSILSEKQLDGIVEKVDRLELENDVSAIVRLLARDPGG